MVWGMTKLQRNVLQNPLTPPFPLYVRKQEERKRITKFWETKCTRRESSFQQTSIPLEAAGHGERELILL